MNGKLVFINGSINSGKSTIGRLLAASLNAGVHIDGDDLVSRDGLAFEQRISKTVQLATEQGCALAQLGRAVCISYPLREVDWKAISQTCKDQGIQVLVVTLAPKLETVLSNRGSRQLTDSERMRISQMYSEGYQSRQFSDVILENDLTSPAQTVKDILSALAI